MGGLATTAKLRRCSSREPSNTADSISGLPKGGLFNGNCQDFMQKKKGPPRVSVMNPFGIKSLATTYSPVCSTIGAEELNDCVRNGNRCDLLAMITKQDDISSNVQTHQGLNRELNLKQTATTLHFKTYTCKVFQEPKEILWLSRWAY